MKTLAALVLVMAFFVACSRVTEQKTDPNVQVSREISFDEDKFSGSSTLCSMSVDTDAIYFHRQRIDIHHLKFDENQLIFKTASADLPKSIFEKFSEWDATAKKNHAEPFIKQISEGYTFSYSGDDSGLNGKWSSREVEKFAELLKQYPEAKAELETRLAKAKRESGLFK